MCIRDRPSWRLRTRRTLSLVSERASIAPGQPRWVLTRGYQGIPRKQDATLLPADPIWHSADETVPKQLDPSRVVSPTTTPFGSPRLTPCEDNTACARAG